MSDAAKTRPCAICGEPVVEGEGRPLRGVWGRGVRHADYSVCATVLNFRAAVADRSGDYAD